MGSRPGRALRAYRNTTPATGQAQQIRAQAEAEPNPDDLRQALHAITGNN